MPALLSVSLDAITFRTCDGFVSVNVRPLEEVGEEEAGDAVAVEEVDDDDDDDEEEIFVFVVVLVVSADVVCKADAGTLPRCTKTSPFVILPPLPVPCLTEDKVRP
jgi:hypothetical protein